MFAPPSFIRSTVGALPPIPTVFEELFSASIDSVGVTNIAYPSPRARNLSSLFTCPKLGSKVRGNLPYCRATRAGVCGLEIGAACPALIELEFRGAVTIRI